MWWSNISRKEGAAEKIEFLILLHFGFASVQDSVGAAFVQQHGSPRNMVYEVLAFQSSTSKRSLSSSPSITQE
ncbi:hypothetical protein AAMO2058_000011300 [Amorphochlora amoebiformis]